MGIRWMAYLSDEDNFVIPGSMCCVTTWSLGCLAVQTPCVLAFDLTGKSHDPNQFRPAHCIYWLVDKAEVWSAVVAYRVNKSVTRGKNLWCLYLCMKRPPSPSPCRLGLCLLACWNRATYLEILYWVADVYLGCNYVLAGLLCLLAVCYRDERRAPCCRCYLWNCLIRLAHSTFWQEPSS